MSGFIKITRRDFLHLTGVGAGALVLGCSISPSGSLHTHAVSNDIPLNAFVAIEPNGTLIIASFRSEMGQGIRSSLATVLADELEADWSRVRVDQADADADRFRVVFPLPLPGAPDLVKGEGAQFTDSSRSMALYFMPMRLFGAGIRLVFVRAGARFFGVDPAECDARQHKVVHRPSGHSVDYKSLLVEATKVAIPTYEESIAALKKPQDFRFIGSDKMPFVDAQDMVTGKAVYGADVDLPGMLTAMIVRCPVANGEVKRFDDTATRKVPGVVNVVEVRLPASLPAGGVGAGFMPHAGVAVVAKNTWAALQGRRALKVEWDLGPNAAYDSQTYRSELEASTAQPGKAARIKGDVDAAFEFAAKVMEADYYVPHLAQAPMEPPSAVALFENGRWEIWSPTQGPELTQHYVGLAMLEPNPLKWLLWPVTALTELTEVKESERQAQRDLNEQLGKLLGVDQPTLIKLRDELKHEIRDKVKVHGTLLGASFGRKSNPDYALEAAFLARQYPGVPIRVQWTREDDIRFSYFHAASHQHLKAAFDGEGHATAWLQRSAFPSQLATFFSPAPSLPEAIRPIFAAARAAYYNGGEYPFASGVERGQGLEDMPFDLQNVRIENCPAQSHIRVGCMRSGSNIFHAFSIGSFADELAIAAGRDSKDYLLELIGKGRVINLTAEGVWYFDNNLFPVDRLWTLAGGQVVPILPGYPPDTRRLRAVVERVAREARWDEKKGKLPNGRGLGIAAHRSFLSYVAVVMDVSLNENELMIHEVHAAIDCGMVVNPDRVRAQMEGGILYGLSLALLGEITVKNGAVIQNDFNDYPVLRIHQTPKKISTYFVSPSPEVVKDLGGEVMPTGVGEPPTPVVAPALANAIVAAGGPRIREVPFRKKIVVR